VAALIERALGVKPELEEGGRGEFTVWVGNEQVAQKGWIRFPSDQKVLAAVQQVFAS
jgi:hypothetical protein